MDFHTYNYHFEVPMKALNITFDNTIKCIYTEEITNKKEFYINKSFPIKAIWLNKEMIPFKEVNLKTNYKQVILNDDYYGKIKIEYEIILDGTTGRFPYVKEKTSDDFYLLRSETIFYPLFITPYQENYYEHFNNPKESDLFLVNIKNHRKQIVLNNLKQGKDGLIGYNPTFAIGYFNEYKQYMDR